MNRRLEDVSERGNSLIATKKRKGPRTLPCGKPDLREFEGDDVSSILTGWWQLERKLEIHLMS